MRTTLTLDDDLAMALQKRARDEGRSFKDVVNEAIRLGLRAVHAPRPVIEVRTLEGAFMPGINLVKANQLAAQLEDEHILERMRAFEERERRHDAGGESS